MILKHYNMKTLLLFCYISIVCVFSGCSCDGWWIFEDESKCEDVYEVDNSYAQAVKWIKDFKEQLIKEASNNAIGIRSLQSANPGEVWILNSCDNSIQNYSASVSDEVPSLPNDLLTNTITNRTVSFDWKRSWSDTTRLSIDIQYDMMELILKSAFSNSQTEGIKFSLSLTQPQLKRQKNMGSYIDSYGQYLKDNDKKTYGNIIISAVLEGKLKIEYLAFNKSGQKVDVDLSLKLNELLDDLNFIPGYQYYNEITSSTEYSIIEESGDFPTVFAIEYFPLEGDWQNKEIISEIIAEDCDDDGISPLIKIVHGYCSSNKLNILDLTIETGVSDKTWYLSWTNLTNQTITNFKYLLEARNRFGQILGNCQGIVVDDINSGKTVKTGSVNSLCFGVGGSIFELYDVQLYLQISDAKNGLTNVCE